MQKIIFLSLITIYLAIMVRFAEAGCHTSGGQMGSHVLSKCENDDDCTQYGKQKKCIDTGLDGKICIYCPCNSTEQCVVSKKGERYRFQMCDCGDDSYGDHCQCKECNCEHHHPNCDEGWKHHNSSCYHVFTDDMDFESAQALCDDEPGGKLVRINDHETNHFLMDAYKDLSGTFWIGARFTDDPNSMYAMGTWKWLPDTVDVGFDNWALGENVSMLLCGYMKINQGMQDNGMWFSADCSTELNFICQYPFPEN